MFAHRWAVLAVVLTGLAWAGEPNGIPAPRTFTYKSDSVTLSTVLDELAKQTGVRVDRAKAESDRALRLDCQKLSFWEALERIARESDHRIGFTDDGRNVRLYGGG